MEAGIKGFPLCVCVDQFKTESKHTVQFNFKFSG